VPFAGFLLTHGNTATYMLEDVLFWRFPTR
jgi:hypothetical protein